MPKPKWTTETRCVHYYRTPGGPLVRGFGSSMEQHRCGHPDEQCWTVVESRQVTPWGRVSMRRNHVKES